MSDELSTFRDTGLTRWIDRDDESPGGKVQNNQKEIGTGYSEVR